MKKIDIYPYRFKTEQEFIEEYGVNWRLKTTQLNHSKWTSGMDYLLGTTFQVTIDNINLNDKEYPIRKRIYGLWFVSWYMLTENKPTVPSYKPKEKIIRIL